MRSSRVHLSLFRRAVQPVSLLINHDHVNINLPAACITQHKIPRPRNLQLYLSVSSLFQKSTKYRDILLLNCNVQVTMSTSLLTKQRINAPSPINPDFDAQLLKGGIQIDYVNRGHLIKIAVRGLSFQTSGCKPWGAPYAGFACGLFLTSGHGFNRAAKAIRRTGFSLPAAGGPLRVSFSSFRGSDL